MTNPHICGHCDKKERSCCTLRAENNDGLPAPVSNTEAKRILNLFDHITKEDILDTRVNSPQFIEQMMLLFPDMDNFIPAAFPSDGMHLELKTIEDACIFKSPSGCILPEKTRPHFCRIYPFWFFGKDLHIFNDLNCLALKKAQTVPEALLALGTNPEKAKQIYEYICEDWGIYQSMPKKQTNFFYNMH